MPTFSIAAADPINRTIIPVCRKKHGASTQGEGNKIRTFHGTAINFHSSLFYSSSYAFGVIIKDKAVESEWHLKGFDYNESRLVKTKALMGLPMEIRKVRGESV